MPTGQQQNFREITDAILKKFPVYDKVLAAQDVNDQLRGILARRAWSGLVKYGILQVPNQYVTGTVSTTQNSIVVTGSGTTWAFNDVCNTTLSQPTIETGIIDATPTAMTNIAPGVWLTIDGGNAGEEAVFVIKTDPTLGTFRANFTKVHSAGVTITSGSMAGRQFRTASNVPFTTVAGLTSASRLLLDQGYPYSNQTNSLYEITLVYVSFGQDVKEMLTMVNPDRQYQFNVNVAKAEIDAQDPRRAVSQMPYKCAYHAPDPGGSPLYELWPRPTSLAAYPYFYVRQWAPLANDNDLLPQGIRSDIILKLCYAEAASWPGHKKLEGGIYYDQQLATRYANESEKGIQEMKNEDDSTAIMQLVYEYKKWRYGGPPPDYYQNDYESQFV